MVADRMRKRISVRNLVEFILRAGSIDSRYTGRNRLEEGARVHRKLQKAVGYQAEVFLSVTETRAGVEFTVEGRADGVIVSESGVTVDEIKSTLTPLDLIDGEYEDVRRQPDGAERSQRDHAAPVHADRAERSLRRLHWAQAMCYGYMYSAKENLEEITIRLTYYEMETGGVRRFSHLFTYAQLRDFFTGLLEIYSIWAHFEHEWKETAITSMKAQGFPFESYREGQRNMAAAVYRTIKAGNRLFAMAPTGVGKTISALFPAVKAMGEGSGEKVFYLTAKTVTRQAAQDALDKLRGGGLRVKSVTLTAKDKICFLEERICRPSHCKYADGHFDRINEAIMDVLRNNDSITAEVVAACAENHRVCPFELALDLTLWSDVIICDYNYLFDPQVYLRRFFADGGEYIFLVDEAHNLADRAREMFSASISKRKLLAAQKMLSGEQGIQGMPGLQGKIGAQGAQEAQGAQGAQSGDSPAPARKRKRCAPPCSRILIKVNKLLLEKRKECGDEKFIVEKEPPREIIEALELFSFELSKWLGENPDPHPDLLEIYFDVLSFLKISELFSESYAMLYESGPGGELTVKQFCADPSSLLDERFNCGRAAVLFSATLTPARYFVDILGGNPATANPSAPNPSTANPSVPRSPAPYIALPSPFKRENLLLLIADWISTKYTDREDSIGSVAEIIYRTSAGKPGNYIAYFPSYRYLADVYTLFCEVYPEIRTVRQEKGMAEGEREEFLARFDGNNENMVAFCVLGGVFSEGIDLTGDKLIGTVIVGTGLPQLNRELDIVKGQFNGSGRGFDFAYRFPGMNKVLQAAGRVIRSEEDRGVVVLIDRRFSTRQYTDLYPEHWRHWRAVGDNDELSESLKKFWAGGQE